MKPEPLITKKLKTGPKKYHYYVTSPDCPLCNAKSKDKDIRLVVDKYLISHSPKEAITMLLSYGIKVGESTVRTHMKNHSPFIEQSRALIQKTAENLALSKIDTIEETKSDPDDVIQEIIDIGHKKVKTGELDVDGKLLLGALKEQGVRKKVGTLRDMLEGLDRSRFGPIKEAEIVEDEDKVLQLEEP